MKKFVKWFVFWTLVLGGLSIAICYIVIPRRTKEAFDIVVGYLNTPIFIAGGTTITIGLVAFVILKFVFGKYKVDFKQELENAKKFVEEQKTKALEYKDNALKEKEEMKQMLSSYDTRIDKITDFLVTICETSPNAKIKALAPKIKDDCLELKQEIKDNLNRLDNEFEVVMEEKVSIKELESKVDELTEKLEKVVNLYGTKEEPND